MTDEFPHTTREYYSCGSVKLNASMDKLALISDSLAEWSAFARSFDSEIRGTLGTGKLNYRKAERALFTDFQNRLLNAVTISHVQCGFELILHEAAVSVENGFAGRTATMRKAAGIRLRTSIHFILHRAREWNLALYPLGHLRKRSVPWIVLGLCLSPPNKNQSLKSEVLSKIPKATAERDQKVADQLFDCIVRSSHFTSADQLGEEYFEAFWKFIIGPLKREFAAETSNTTYSKHKSCLNKIFTAIYDLGQFGLNSEIRFEYTSKHYEQIERNEKSQISTGFNWIKEIYPDVDLDRWADAFSWWVHHRPLKSPTSLVISIKPFIAFLAELKNPPPSPEEYTRSHTINRPDSPEVTYLDYLKREDYWDRPSGYNAVLDVRKFFEDWHDAWGTHLPDWSLPVRKQDHPEPRSSLGKTSKEILPVRIIRLLKEIITESDYAWPKTQRADYFEYFNTDTSIYTREWCPTRALAILTLLTIPIRSVQVRMEDSGEADENVYDANSQRWIRNVHPLAESGRAHGFWTPLFDGTTRKNYVGIHITTNKTAAIGAADFEKGYNIPWDCAELRPHIDHLINWQRTFNPVSRLLSRKDFVFDKERPSNTTKNLYGYTFLFRDPANFRRPADEPVSYDRLASFLGKALEEAERRLREGGEDVTLVTYASDGDIRSPYTLHSLRAAGITHFIQGGVPIQVVAEFIAGHANFIMTLHYTKLGPAYVTDTIDKALEQLDKGIHDDFVRFLRDSPLNGREDRLVGNSAAAFSQLADTTPGLWSVGIDGICPNGRSSCHKGGLVASTQKHAYYGPVPGGTRNCPLCRFWLTGPEFLPGQITSLNAFCFMMGEKANSLNKATRELAELIAGNSTNTRQIRRLESQIEGMTVELETIVEGYQERVKLIYQSYALRDKVTDTGDGKNALITRLNEEDLQIVFEETSSWEHIEFVAQAFEFFPQIGETNAPLRKGRLLDQLLTRNGYRAFFFEMPEEEALRCANALTRMLQGFAGRNGTQALVDGSQTLKSLGLTQQFEGTLQKLLGAAPLKISPRNMTTETSAPVP